MSFSGKCVVNPDRSRVRVSYREPPCVRWTGCLTSWLREGESAVRVAGLTYSETMCGRFAENRDLNALRLWYDATDPAPPEDWWSPSWNIAPTQLIPMVVDISTTPESIERKLVAARWSLTPQWSQSLVTPYSTFNARIETAAQKPTFKAAVRSKRAIIPASGYYEWVGGGSSRRPHFIYLPDDEPLALAGLYSWWADPNKGPEADDRWHLTVTMLTSDSVQTIADVHDREPVPLPKSMWAEWLDPTREGDQQLLNQAAAASATIADRLVHHEVAPLKGDGPELISRRG